MTLAPERPPTPKGAGPAGMSADSRRMATDALRGTLPFKAMSTFGDFYTFVARSSGPCSPPGSGSRSSSRRPGS